MDFGTGEGLTVRRGTQIRQRAHQKPPHEDAHITVYGTPVEGKLLTQSTGIQNASGHAQKPREDIFGDGRVKFLIGQNGVAEHGTDVIRHESFPFPIRIFGILRRVFGEASGGHEIVKLLTGDRLVEGDVRLSIP